MSLIKRLASFRDRKAPKIDFTRDAAKKLTLIPKEIDSNQSLSTSSTGQLQPTPEASIDDALPSTVPNTLQSLRITEETDPWGLKLLYCEEPIVDIVAVHGLNGHREKTWTWENTQNQNENVLWLRDLLPGKIPQARVWTWGYDSRTHTKSHSDRLTVKSLYDHGKELVFDLDRERRDSESHQRPIIFVAHSLGGIVVKSALLQYDRVRKGNLQEQRSVKLSTYGIIFMGTPHQGGQGVSIGKILLNIAKLQGNTNDRYLNHLQEHSEFLEQQNSEFTSIGQDFDMRFAYETKPIAVGGFTKVIVPKWSAVIPGTPDAAEFGINEDHRRMTKFWNADNNDFLKLSRELEYMVRKAKAKIEDNWYLEGQIYRDKQMFQIPFNIRGVPIVGKYIPRDVEMKNLELSLCPGEEHQQRKLFVLHGLGGIGKTQLSLAYARKHRRDYSAIFWLDGQSQESLKQSLAKVVKQLPQGYISEPARNYTQQGSDQLNRTVEEVIAWFDLKGNTRWLLIYDNVDRECSTEIKDPEAYDIDEYMPQTDQGSIIITTRQSQLRNRGDGLKVTEMTINEGIEVLASRKHLSLTDKLLAPELAKLLGCLPLALAQAGSYMHETNTGIVEYVNLYRTTWHDLMEDEAASISSRLEYGKRSIQTTWLISFHCVKQKNEAAAKMLQIWACLDNRDIWFELFNNSEPGWGILRAPNLPDWFTTAIGDKLSFNKIVHTLLAYSLIEATVESNSYGVHPVVHRWCQDRFSPTEREDFAQLALLCVGYALPPVDNVQFWQTQVRLFPHADRCFQLLTDSFHESVRQRRECMSRAFVNIGSIYSNQGKLTKAEKLWALALTGYEVTVGPKDRRTLDLVQKLALLYADCGRFERSECMLQRVLGILEAELGLEHEQVFSVYRDLGFLYGKQEKLEEAKDMYQRALVGYERMLGPNALHTLEIVRALAVLSSEQNKPGVEVEATYQRALTGFEAALGPNHVETLRAVYSLANFYRDQGKLTGGVESMYQRALSGLEQTCGSNHIDTLKVMSNLGNFYLLQGNFVAAEDLDRRALTGYEKMQGLHHKRTLDAVYNVGISCSRQDKHLDAEMMFQRALTGYETTLGLNHKETLKAIQALGYCFYNQDKFTEAETMYQRAFVGYENNLGLDDPLTWRCADNLQYVYKKQGKLAEAEALNQWKERKEASEA